MSDTPTPPLASPEELRAKLEAQNEARLALIRRMTQGQQVAFLNAWNHPRGRSTIADLIVALGNEYAEAAVAREAAEQREAAALARAEAAERDMVRAVHYLAWARDLMKMYEDRLVQMGDPKHLVHSNTHSLACMVVDSWRGAMVQKYDAYRPATPDAGGAAREEMTNG